MNETRKSSQSERDTEEQGTLLIVEDEQLMLRLMEKLLSQHGYRVFTAADGEEAVDIYRCHKDEIDVVLLDVGLPRMPGWDVLVKMKAENPNVRVVIASGFLESEMKKKMYSAGVKHFITKPYPLDDIVKTLQSLVGAKSKTN
jgi:two-component system, cell cycle sensor histidine kinase and response regulator CckA